jgi:murein L,D-transpeptidase YafK
MTLSAALLVATDADARSFREGQLGASRVKAARERVGEQVRQMFEDKGVAYPARELLLRSLKRDRQVELWGGNEAGGELTLIRTFSICADSGQLGPKRQAGDLQVPEGFYVVDRYNAWSNFHLSLGLNYPNVADQRVGRAKGIKKLGYNIFIHGDCVTIGCVPLEDGPIELLYLAALDTRLAYGKTQGALEVHMLPGRLDDAGLEALITDAEPDDELLAFWENLKEGWDAFEATHRKPRVSVDKRGRYRVKPRR